MLVSKDFKSKRLTATNIKQYLQQNYFFGEEISELNRKQLSVPIFLQKNYGKDGDCTLTSILTLTKYYNKLLDPNEVYNHIEYIASRRYLYNGDSYGTIPFFNRGITAETFKHFGINKPIISKYIKGVGFNLETILDALDQDIPVMISMFRDGRGYYDNHTITIIGYIQYKDNHGKIQTMFLVHDNWYSSYSFLDYNAISPISMICY